MSDLIAIDPRAIEKETELAFDQVRDRAVKRFTGDDCMPALVLICGGGLVAQLFLRVPDEGGLHGQIAESINQILARFGVRFRIQPLS